MGNGLELMLDIQQDEYLPVWGETGEAAIVPQLCVCPKTKKCNTFLGLSIWSHVLWLPADETSFEAGVKVQIHSQDEPSFIDQFGFGVAPGFQTFVSCQEQRVHIGFVQQMTQSACD